MNYLFLDTLKSFIHYWANNYAEQMEKNNQSSVTEFVFLAFANISRWNVLLFMAFLVSYLIVLVENVALLIIIGFDHRLHTPMYFFLWNMSFIETCYTFVIIPRFMISLLTKNNAISLTGCATQMFFYIGLGDAEVFLVVVMAYDRYVAVSNPLRYKTIMSEVVCLKFLVAILVVSFLLSLQQVILVFHLPYCGSNEIDHFFCDVAQILILAAPCVDMFYVYWIVFNIYGFISFSVPIVLILISYIYIIVAILKIRNAEGRRKAFSSCSSHLTVVVLTYSCLIFIYLRPKSTYRWDKNKVFFVIYTFTSAVLNPLIYTLRNKAVKSAFRKAIFRRTA
uniref:Olfactory receptor n=1 Tax=Geotrypetes seraphini TaxID=260995 RepID=A0A6P8S6E3_GEOSA|nr:olfactory receptor 10V1-like [Geotrypetes seraphini]